MTIAELLLSLYARFHGSWPILDLAATSGATGDFAELWAGLDHHGPVTTQELHDALVAGDDARSSFGWAKACELVLSLAHPDLPSPVDLGDPDLDLSAQATIEALPSSVRHLIAAGVLGRLPEEVPVHLAAVRTAVLTTGRLGEIVRPTAVADGSPPGVERWVLLWNRTPWRARPAARLHAPHVAAPTDVAHLFPYVRCVRDHGDIDLVTLPADARPPGFGRDAFLLGAAAVVDDLSQIATSTDGHRYHLGLAPSSPTPRASPVKVLRNADRAGVHLLVAPEGVGGPAEESSWGDALAGLGMQAAAASRDWADAVDALRAELDEGSLDAADAEARREELKELRSHRPPPFSPTWIVAGSGPTPGASPPGNRAVLLGRRDSSPHWGRLLAHDKMRPFQMTVNVARRWGLLPHPDVPVDSDAVPTDGNDVLHEDIANGRSIKVLETPVARLAVLICEDLARGEEHLDLLRRIGPTHVAVLVFDTELDQGRWEAHDAARLVEATGAAVLIVNSTAVARHRRKADHRGSEDGIGAALWSERGRVRSPIVARSRRADDVMIPQYGLWGSPLGVGDLEPGDLLFFLRGPADEHLGGLNAAIAGWDQTSIVHVALVTEPGVVHLGATRVADSYDRVEERPLSRLVPYGDHHGRGSAPAFVSRLRDPRHATGLLEQLRPILAREPEKDLLKDPYVYPFVHLFYAALALRARLGGVDAARVDAWTGLLAAAARRGGDQGFMCGALLLVAAERLNARSVASASGVPPLDLGLSSRGEVPPGAATADVLGRAWLGDVDLVALGAPVHTDLAQMSAYVQKVGSTFPVTDVRRAVAQVLDHVAHGTLSPGKAAIVDTVRAALGESDLPAALQPLLKVLTGSEQAAIRSDLVAALAAPVAPDEDWPNQARHLVPTDRRPARLGTVSDLLRSPDLVHLGHVHRWWSTTDDDR